MSLHQTLAGVTGVILVLHLAVSTRDYTRGLFRAGEAHVMDG